MLKKFKKYNLIIILTVMFSIKYYLLIWLIPEKKLINLINKPSNLASQASTLVKAMQPKAVLISIVGKVFNIISKNASCLIRSLVIRDVLKVYGFHESIFLGVNFDKNLIKAHAWVSSSKNDSHIKVYKLL